LCALVGQIKNLIPLVQLLFISITYSSASVVKVTIHWLANRLNLRHSTFLENWYCRPSILAIGNRMHLILSTVGPYRQTSRPEFCIHPLFLHFLYRQYIYSTAGLVTVDKLVIRTLWRESNPVSSFFGPSSHSQCRLRSVGSYIKMSNCNKTYKYLCLPNSMLTTVCSIYSYKDARINIANCS